MQSRDGCIDTGLFKPAKKGVDYYSLLLISSSLLSIIITLFIVNLLSCILALGLNGLVLRWVYVVHRWPMLTKLSTWEWS